MREARRDRRRERCRRLRKEMAELNAARREQINQPRADRRDGDRRRRLRHPAAHSVPVAASGPAAVLAALCGVRLCTSSHAPATRLPPDVAAQIVRHVAAMRIAST